MSTVAERIAALKKKEEEQKQARENPNPKTFRRSQTKPISNTKSAKIETFRKASSVRVSTSASAFGNKKHVNDDKESKTDQNVSTGGSLKSKIAALENKSSHSSTSSVLVTKGDSNKVITKGNGITKKTETEIERVRVKEAKRVQEMQAVEKEKEKSIVQAKEKLKGETKRDKIKKNEKVKSTLTSTKSEREDLLARADFTKLKKMSSARADVDEVSKRSNKATSEKGDGQQEKKSKPEIKKGNSVRDRIRQMKLNSLGEEQQKKESISKTKERLKVTSSVAEKRKAILEKAKSGSGTELAPKVKALSGKSIDIPVQSNSVTSRLTTLQNSKSQPSKVSTSASAVKKITESCNEDAKNVGKPKMGSKIQLLTGKMQIPIPLPGMGISNSLAKKKETPGEAVDITNEDVTEPKAIRHLSLARPKMKNRGRRRPKSLKAVVHTATGKDGTNTLSSLVQSFMHEEQERVLKNTEKTGSFDANVEEAEAESEDENTTSGNIENEDGNSQREHEIVDGANNENNEAVENSVNKNEKSKSNELDVDDEEKETTAKSDSNSNDKEEASDDEDADN